MRRFSVTFALKKNVKKTQKTPKKPPIFTHYSKRSRFDQIYLLFDNNSIARLNIIHKTYVSSSNGMKKNQEIKQSYKNQHRRRRILKDTLVLLKKKLKRNR